MAKVSSAVVPACFCAKPPLGWMVLFVSIITAASVPAPDASGQDWLAWRGPHNNGTVDQGGLIERFNPRGGPDSGVVWKSEQGAGISTPVAMNGRLFTITRHQPGTPTEAEKVVCLDAESGQLVWENVTNVFLSDVPAERVGWSHVAADKQTDSVFAMGACCLLKCIDADTGDTRWSRSLSEEFGMLSTYGGRTNTPVIFDDLVIISGVTTGWGDDAQPAHRFLAFDKISGELIWKTATRTFPEDTTYSTPVFGVVAGKGVMVSGSGDGSLYVFDPRTGARLGSVQVSRRGVNTSPVISDDGRVFIAHGEENPTGTLMGAVVGVDLDGLASGSTGSELWRTEELIVGKSSPLLVGDRLYVVEDSSRLHVLDADTGTEIGEPLKLGTSMRGSLIFADGKIYACTATGYFYVLRPSTDGVEVVSKTRLPKGHDVGGSPIVAFGRIYLPTTGGIFCLATEAAANVSPDSADGPAANESAANESAANEAAVDEAAVDEATPVASDLEVTQWQIVPAEAIVQPGQHMVLRLIGYNSAGRAVRESQPSVQWTVDGDGAIDENGNLTVGDSSHHSALTIKAVVGDAVATARYRIIPALPWNFDFIDGQVPITWIGARYRHEARQIDGNHAIVKITTIPKGTRSQTWFGSPEMSDYTVTADVQAAAGNAKLPDIGLIAQRYTMDLMGESQQLQIRTWSAQLRMAKSVPFQWTAGTWYRLKFRAANEDGKAVLRAKVWQRDSDEPEKWTLVATDDSPNLTGSPGLFGNSTNAEIVIGNVAVDSNAGER
ncbi:outer membrane biogenesis protein BamB [Rubripirellula lacrimiformis]|uniref:Outer membrane biogenesis protein BamB n=1 Tax=Rubripirellula lacrimiformis TaxID=1930273 RepID=A0A517NAG9_9BACT|nr:PQQ-binding-like beta-propeller repeat protein [Rubripirellula lacrimiformis]QDT04122.1 outer membrane biogenesis protein BamB [Rubripirellula lacrimiformis]